MGFPREQYWDGLPCPPPENLPDRIELASPAVADGFFTTSTTWEAPSYPHTYAIHLVICNSRCLYLPNIPCIQPLLTVSTINTLVQATIFSQCLAYGRCSMNICTFPVHYSISLLLLLRLDPCSINLLILKEYITVLLLKKME